MFKLESVHAQQGQSPTAVIWDNAKLFGATPARDEFDPRDIWEEDDALQAVAEAFRVLSENIAPDGTQLADEKETLLWGFLNTLHAQVRRLDRSADRV